jgi:hypothetical protein
MGSSICGRQFRRFFGSSIFDGVFRSVQAPIRLIRSVNIDNVRQLGSPCLSTGGATFGDIVRLITP